MRKLILGLMAAAGTASAAGAQQAVPARAGPTRIKNATILTVTKGTLEKTDLLLQNG